MLDVSVCKRVSERDTLHQAITALSDPSMESADTKYPMETLLVEDAKEQISGVLTLWDILAGLEPGYRNIGAFTRIPQKYNRGEVAITVPSLHCL